MDLTNVAPQFHAMLHARVAEVRACVAQGMPVLPCVFMGVMGQSEEVPLMLNFDDDAARTRSMDTARSLARELRADYVVTVMPSEEVESVDDIQSVVLASVKVTLETPSACWVLQARLQPGEAPGDPLVLEEFELRDLSRLEAILFGVLPA